MGTNPYQQFYSFISVIQKHQRKDETPFQFIERLIDHYEKTKDLVEKKEPDQPQQYPQPVPQQPMPAPPIQQQAPQQPMPALPIQQTNQQMMEATPQPQQPAQETVASPKPEEQKEKKYRFKLYEDMNQDMIQTFGPNWMNRVSPNINDLHRMLGKIPTDQKTQLEMARVYKSGNDYTFGSMIENGRIVAFTRSMIEEIS